MKREITEDTLKQCRNIEIDCRDIKSCIRKKLCRDTSELSHNKSWQIKKASHVEFATKKILMLRQTFQTVTRSRHEICRDISKLYRDI